MALCIQLQRQLIHLFKIGYKFRKVLAHGHARAHGLVGLCRSICPAVQNSLHLRVRHALCATDDPLAEQRLQSIAGVETVTCTNMRFTIRGRGDDLVTEVIRCLSENRMRVSDFRTIIPNLEDVFLKLTGHSIRE